MSEFFKSRCHSFMVLVGASEVGLHTRISPRSIDRQSLGEVVDYLVRNGYLEVEQDGYHRFYKQRRAFRFA